MRKLRSNLARAKGAIVIFEHLSAGGCQSYLVGCTESCAAVLIDPEISLIDRYLALAARDGLRIRYLVDTHTHADHFSATRDLARRLGLPVAMHRGSPAPFVDLRLDDGEMLVVGKLRLQVLHTPGHTPGSQCFLVQDHLISGDTLFIGACGRCDLPGSNPEDMYVSLTQKLAKLDDRTIVFPGHNYAPKAYSTIADEKRSNPYLQFQSLQDFLRRGMRIVKMS